MVSVRGWTYRSEKEGKLLRKNLKKWMDFDLETGIVVLERTPKVMRAWLQGLPDPWVFNNEGGDSWSPFDVLGHFIHGERTDWIPRAEIILSEDQNKTFEPFNRLAQFEDSEGKSLDELLNTFEALRANNLEKLRGFELQLSDYERTGLHPELGTVTLRQLLATWVAHDLNHLGQIAAVMARQYRRPVAGLYRHFGASTEMTRPHIIEELYGDLRSGHAVRLKFTQKAFQLLPRLDALRILDVGCGEGEPTLALARLSQGQVIGLDTNQPALDRLLVRIKKAGLADQVQVVNCSMLEMSFPDGCFDLIWAEGSIHVIGFERGLRSWRRFIKPEGFLTVHEMTWLRPDPAPEIVDHWRRVYPGLSTASEYIEQIPSCGYELIGHFLLPDEAWWDAYYGPLEARLGALRERYAGDRVVHQEILDPAQHEVELYKKYASWYGSGFYVMQQR